MSRDTVNGVLNSDAPSSTITELNRCRGADDALVEYDSADSSGGLGSVGALRGRFGGTTRTRGPRAGDTAVCRRPVDDGGGPGWCQAR